METGKASLGPACAHCVPTDHRRTQASMPGFGHSLPLTSECVIDDFSLSLLTESLANVSPAFASSTPVSILFSAISQARIGLRRAANVAVHRQLSPLRRRLAIIPLLSPLIHSLKLSSSLTLSLSPARLLFRPLSLSLPTLTLTALFTSLPINRGNCTFLPILLQLSPARMPQFIFLLYFIALPARTKPVRRPAVSLS